MITTLYSLIVKKLRVQSFYGVRNLVVHFSQGENRNRNILKMSMEIMVVFFLSMSPFVVYLSVDLFSDGRAFLLKNFRFCFLQYLVQSNGALNLFLTSSLIKATVVVSLKSFPAFSARVVCCVVGDGRRWI